MSTRAPGPLVRSTINPRYFAVASGEGEERAVYLTGSHVNNNFHDGAGPGPDCAERPERFDFPAYLDFLTERGHNFIRLWRWELFRSQAAAGAFHLCMSPQPWPRRGPGAANDGRPAFDLAAFDPAYFDRLREYAIAAGEVGIYVSVMFFEGFSLTLSPRPDNIEGHPFCAGNNTNGIAITSIKDYQVLPLEPGIQALQEAYIRKVVDTVHDLPNVLYEVANESPGGGAIDEAMAEMLGLAEIPDWGDTTQWQYWVIERIRRHEEEMGYAAHPVGMTMQFPVADQTEVNQPLSEGPADWISPGYDDDVFTEGRNPMTPGNPPSRWFVDPPPADGTKVVVTDTDHYSPMHSDALWAWKSFLRGHNPILYDLGIVMGVDPADPDAGTPSLASHEPTRWAMGDTCHFAGRIDLLAATPAPAVSSTGFALVQPGAEYLVLAPDGAAEPFTVRVAPGRYATEWFSLEQRETTVADEVRVEREDDVEFVPSFPGPAVLYLRAT